MEVQNFTVDKDQQLGWYILVTNASGEVVNQIVTGTNKKETIAECASREATYKHDYAVDFLTQALPSGVTLTIVQKLSRPQHNLYSVCIALGNEVVCLDDYLHDACIASYVYRPNNTCGVEAYGAGNLATAISEKLTGQPRSYRWVEIK